MLTLLLILALGCFAFGMAYTGTKAQSANQAAVYINGTGALAAGVWTFTPGTVSSPVWTLIGEINDFNQSGKSVKTDDATNLQSSAEEFIPTILSPGKFAGVWNRLSADGGQMAVAATFNQVPPVMASYKVQLPKNASQTTTGDLYTFTALCEELNDLGTLKPDKIIKTPFSFKVSGVIVETQGS